MKKICIVTTSHFAQDTRVFHKEAKTLSNSGYEVSLVAQCGESTGSDKIKIIPLPKARGRFSRFITLPQKAYTLALKEKASIYHFHDPELIPWMIRLKKRTKEKIIYDVHEDFPRDILQKKWLPRKLRKIISLLFDFYEKKTAKDFDYLIVVNNELKEAFLKKGVRNLEIISNYPILRKEWINKKRAPLNKEKPSRLIYVGSLSEEYGIKEMVSAQEILSSKVNFDLIGNFEDVVLERKIKQKKIPNLNFIGKIPHQEVYGHLINADIGLICFSKLPNYLNAGIGSNKLFEYMAAGLPIIASDFPNLKKIIENNRCGICVDSSKPQEIIRAIEYLIENPDVAREMGENGKKAALEKYNWDIEAQKLLKVYQTLCAE